MVLRYLAYLKQWVSGLAYMSSYGNVYLVRLYLSFMKIIRDKWYPYDHNLICISITVTVNVQSKHILWSQTCPI